MNADNIDIVADDLKRDTRYLYNGKEMNEELGWLDYGARFYDPSIARWNSVDPLVDSFPSISSYVHSFNNPVRFLDRDGRAPEDIIVLIGSKGARNLGKGHSAVLIGNDKEGWTYVSKDGGKFLGSGESRGESGKKFSTLNDFEKDDLASHYDSGYQIETDSDTDKAALEKAQEKFEEDFGPSGECNCTSVPKAALKEAGVETSKDWKPSELENDLQNNPMAKEVNLSNNKEN